jgi:hypothetical protein
MEEEPKKKHAGGRKKIVLDLNLIAKLATIHCTKDEIANFVGVSTDTLNRNHQFCAIYKRSIEEGRMSLRRLQWSKAQDGNVTMLIWLGKQYLGQADKTDITTGGKEFGNEAIRINDAALQRSLVVLRDAGCLRPLEATEQSKN